MKVMGIILLIIVLLAGALVVAGQAGLLRGTPPTDLGVMNGRLKAVAESSRNSVSSQTSHAANKVEPLHYDGDGKAAFTLLKSVVAGMAGATLVRQEPNYIHAEFATLWLRFVDDVEFYLDEGRGVIEVRSASRLGKGDFGVNRARVEAIRRAFSAAQSLRK